MRKIEKVMLIVFLVISVICGKYLLDYWQDSYDNRKNYREMEEIAFPEKTTEEDETEPNADNPMTEIDDFDYQALLDENADCIGWLKIDGTDISYPVVQGKDNEFYLHHDFQKGYAICGTLMLDCRNDIEAEQEHLIIYGHQMKDGSMFKQLNGYKKEEFYHEHKEITLYLENKKYQYEVAAVYVTNVAQSGGYYDFLHKETRKQQMDYLQKMAAYQLYPTGVTVREDDLFSVLNEAGYKVGNMRVDMNPIRPDKTGTLEDFLEKSERYLDEKTEQMKAKGEYKPLAKVEELVEANYNMIDNVLNNMPPKKEPYLEYYAAECDEYHSLGKIYKSINLDEIVAKYREIIEDPTLSYYGNGMGIIYRDPNDTFYDEAEVSLVSRKTIRGDNLDDVAFLAALPMVHEALEKIVEAFSDFRYYPPKELDVHYYPEKMNADELAAALDQLAEDFDHYDYHDNFSPEEDMVETVALELRCGYAHRYIPFLKDIIDEECEESPRAEELLEKLKAYQPEIPETAVPVVCINFCEDKEMNISGYQKLGTLDETTAKMDAELASKADPKTGMPEKTVQMYFTIYYPDRDQMQELKGKINIGDGNGGIVSQLKNQNEMKLHDESWLNYQKGKGEESFQAYMADLTDMQEHVLPYLQSFCSLEERAPERSVEPTTVSKSEMETGKTIASVGNEKSKTVQTERKSIHERLKINKEIIAKQQGKDSKEKGVELA